MWCGPIHENRVAQMGLVYAAKHSSCCDRHIFRTRDLEGTQASGSGGFPTKRVVYEESKLSKQNCNLNSCTIFCNICKPCIVPPEVVWPAACYFVINRAFFLKLIYQLLILKGNCVYSM